MSDTWILTKEEAIKLKRGLVRRRRQLRNMPEHNGIYSSYVYLDRYCSGIGWHFMENPTGCMGNNRWKQKCLCLQKNSDNTYTLTRHYYMDGTCLGKK